MENKKVFRYFTIFEYEKEQAFLRQMHQSGWKFVSVSGFGIYHFEKCPPEDVIYQLDYNKEGIAHKDEYVKMFNDCGWEYLQDYVGYSYFRKPAAQAVQGETIFCDSRSRLQMLERVFMGKVLPLLCLLPCVFIPCILISLLHGAHSIAIPLAIAFVFCLFVLEKILFQYRKLKRNE